MSRKNKNLRAFLHQNPEPTIEQAWDAAWSGAQKTFHARSMQEIRSQVDRLREALEGAADCLEEADYTGAANRIRLLLRETKEISHE